MSERGTHGDEPSDVGRVAARRHVVENVGVGAVEQEAHDKARAFARIDQFGESSAVLSREKAVGVVGEWRAAEQRADRRRDVDQARRAGHEPELAHAFPGEHEWRSGLDEAEGAVLTEMPALILPIVRGGVEHAEIGRGRGVEELGDLFEGVLKKRQRIEKPLEKLERMLR